MLLFFFVDFPWPFFLLSTIEYQKYVTLVQFRRERFKIKHLQNGTSSIGVVHSGYPGIDPYITRALFVGAISSGQTIWRAHPATLIVSGYVRFCVFFVRVLYSNLNEGYSQSLPFVNNGFRCVIAFIINSD